METLIRSDYKIDLNYTTSDSRILDWILNTLLNCSVFVHSVYGMIDIKTNRFRVPRALTYTFIAKDWYLVAKFMLVALILYFFSALVDMARLQTAADFNCSVSSLVDAYHSSAQRQRSASAGSSSQGNAQLTLWFAPLAEPFGGPFKFMGNRATLIYCWYFIGLYSMFAIFPTELLYFHIPFNLIQFALNARRCLAHLRLKKKRHLSSINNWSRHDSTSILTLSMKKTFNRRHLRCLAGCEQLSSPQARDLLDGARLSQLGLSATNGKRLSRWRLSIEQNFGRLANLDLQPNKPVTSLRELLATNHREQQSYDMCVANRNVDHFLPFARTVSWYRSASKLYVALLIYFFLLSLSLDVFAIVYFWNGSSELYKQCSGSRGLAGAASLFEMAHASWLDWLLFAETLYAALLIPIGCSFYCTYYFCTIFELLMWIGEVEQQLDLCRLVIELGDFIRLDVAALRPGCARYHYRLDERRMTRQQPVALDSPDGLMSGADYLANRRIGRLADELLAKYGLDAARLRHHTNPFGGYDCIRSTFQGWSQSERLKLRGIMAIKLLTRKQTLLLATYLNFNLFLDEFKETKFMMKLILRRTTEYTFGFAVAIALTRSQFKSNYLNLTGLMGLCLGILNMYLVAAAIINTRVNGLLKRMHQVVCATLSNKTSASNRDFLEFWVRHIHAIGVNSDTMCYKIYGVKLTWSRLINFNGAVISAYFFTTY